jgi:hypothetical protein
MARLLTAVLAMMIMMSCNNGANDGNAKTDTTSLPPDSNINMDTSNHVNTNAGMHYDTTNRAKQ